MYISADLPKMYGAFSKIRDDNYPFNRHFTRYLEAIVTIGLNTGQPIEDLVGFIEDALMGDDRLPDIPKGNKAITFRYAVKNESILTYYKMQTLTNRDVTLMIIQMTLRLSAKFGASLPRLVTKIEQIQWDEPEVIEPAPIKVKVRPTAKAVKEVVTPEVIPEPVQEPKPVEAPKPVEEVIPESTVPQPESTAIKPSQAEMINRLKSITDKAASLDDAQGRVEVKPHSSLGSFLDLDD